MEWQTIDTAPRDGTRIIAFEGGVSSVVAWRAMHYGQENWGPDDGESVYVDGAFCPTHWMPLPDPPTAAYRRGE